MAQSGSKDRPGSQKTAQTPPTPFFQNRAQLVLTIFSGVGVISLILGGGFFFGALNMKTEFGERIAKVESKLDVFESAVRKQLIAKAQELLGTSDVQVALVNQRSNIISPISEGRPSLSVPGGKGEKKWFVHYEIEGIINKTVILRTWLDEEIQGKITRTLDDGRIKILLPMEEKRVTYDFKLEDEKSGFSTPPVRLEIVILEQVSSETLVVALA